MMEDELKPCPFCGSSAELKVLRPGELSVIRCTNHHCYMAFPGAFTSWNNGDTDEHAELRLSTAWNRREGKAVNTEWKCADQELPEMHKQTIDDHYGHVEFEESDPVLAYAPEHGMVVCVAENSGGRVYWVDDVGVSYHVTHWMNLPEAPTT